MRFSLSYHKWIKILLLSVSLTAKEGFTSNCTGVCDKIIWTCQSRSDWYLNHIYLKKRSVGDGCVSDTMRHLHPLIVFCCLLWVIHPHSQSQTGIQTLSEKESCWWLKFVWHHASATYFYTFFVCLFVYGPFGGIHTPHSLVYICLTLHLHW